MCIVVLYNNCWYVSYIHIYIYIVIAIIHTIYIYIVIAIIHTIYIIYIRFAYSMREKTNASRTMIDDVPENIKQSRLREVLYI